MPQLPIFLFNKAFWIGLGVVVLIALLTLGIYEIFKAGGEKQAASQANAQIAENNKVKGKYAKILNKVPNGGNDAAIRVFILSYTSGGQ